MASKDALGFRGEEASKQKNSQNTSAEPTTGERKQNFAWLKLHRR